MESQEVPAQHSHPPANPTKHTFPPPEEPRRCKLVRNTLNPLWAVTSRCCRCVPATHLTSERRCSSGLAFTARQHGTSSASPASTRTRGTLPTGCNDDSLSLSSDRLRVPGRFATLAQRGSHLGCFPPVERPPDGKPDRLRGPGGWLSDPHPPHPPPLPATFARDASGGSWNRSGASPWRRWLVGSAVRLRASPLGPPRAG